MSFPARRFALAISAAAAVLISAATTHATALASAASADEGLKCHVIPLHDPSPAEKAYLSGNASQAEMLYREALAKSPHDAALIAALVRTLLREQKVTDADSTITAELPSAPNSAPLLTCLRRGGISGGQARRSGHHG